MSAKKKIPEEKARRIAVGATVGGVLLIIFFVVILAVQIVQIGVANSKKDRLDDQIDEYRQAIESGEKNLEWYQTENGLYWYARTYGWQ